ncbi:hypothetical protein [Polymorphospora rubra]|uniref:Uncharacterized protein n=1 Tax=Polymorphospora rubra TaxID=338584 RepID=A0A810N1S9_9ACTN|nr:hypothetical protein [Polymorphospora rubra]BCJ65648.1 hypothetical protein Prubr_26690 [Polymorphospora rubra]
MNPQAAGCRCPRPWRRLFTVIADDRYDVVPTLALTPTSALYRAWCSDCGTEYPWPFRVEQPSALAA